MTKTADEVILAAIGNGGRIALEDFGCLYGSKYAQKLFDGASLTDILQGARMVWSDVKLPVDRLIVIYQEAQ